MLDECSTSKLRDLSTHFQERKRRAKERIEEGLHPGWYFGIIGLQLKPSTFALIPDHLVIEEVIEPPGEIELVKRARHF